MMYKVYAAFLMSLGIALALASDQAFGGPKGGVSASPHSAFHRSFARSHHFRRHRGAFFPGDFFWGGDFSGPYDQPYADVAPPISGPTSNDTNYTCKFDFPWDWAHRCPPSFFASTPQPSSPPMAYVPGCARQTVTVPGADGKDQTVNVVRC
jgi:hypothetical protein